MSSGSTTASDDSPLSRSPPGSPTFGLSTALHPPAQIAAAGTAITTWLTPIAAATIIERADLVIHRVYGQQPPRVHAPAQ
jgi:hypothetical protein